MGRDARRSERGARGGLKNTGESPSEVLLQTTDDSAISPKRATPEKKCLLGIF
jgi:hypothetical protein